MAENLDDPVNLRDFEALAAARLPKVAYDFYAIGAGDGLTLRENQQAYDRLRLKYHVLRDVSRRDLSTTILGQPVSMPILIPPMAFQGLAHPDGEVGTAKAAGAAGTIMAVSTFANCALEDVKVAASGPLWFQLYIFRDRAVSASLVQRAEAAGYSSIVLTVDAPLLGRRGADVRNKFRLPADMVIKNLQPYTHGRLPAGASGEEIANYFVGMLDASLTWKDVEWLRSITRLPILVKGVIRPDDAQRAVDSGVAGIIVSNHGGRQLDTASATITVLPEIAEAVAGRIEVLVDGGIRRGTDVIKALALGARAVLIGRPILWGLAAGGEPGVTRVLDLLRDELDLTMALCGCPSVGDATKELIA